ncbi:MAG: helix-turn-helix transcriptional regulator [Candidatus Eisenbacteria bacterium]|nr:helix-turn-helix transcriptional regulator [Candidatus Eisenbacteria bacterium]
MNYGKGIRTIRAARGLTQKQLASAVRVDSSFMSLLERGARAPSIGTLEAIAEALGVPVYLLILFSSDKDDLRGITPDQAQLMGMHILEVLMQTDDEAPA